MILEDDRADGVIGALEIAHEDIAARAEHRDAVMRHSCAHPAVHFNGAVELLYCDACRESVERIASRGV